MRALIQRASSASVLVEGATVGELRSPGLLILVGVTHDDTAEIAARLADKAWQLRILADERSASDVGAPILVVSQFTLYANTRKGRRPSWNAAAPGGYSEGLVGDFCEALRTRGAEVSEGIFGADMLVALVNDGPVTVLLDSADWR